MTKQNIECNHEWTDQREYGYLCRKCKVRGEKVHPPKVELPEWGNEYILFERPTISIHKFMAQKSSGIFYEMKEERLDTLLSHSTTQLVEKIMGEVEKLEIQIRHKEGEYMGEELAIQSIKMGFNQALSEVINIIKKYRRVLDDYMYLCKPCHCKYDMEKNGYVPGLKRNRKIISKYK